MKLAVSTRSSDNCLQSCHVKNTHLSCVPRFAFLHRKKEQAYEPWEFLSMTYNIQLARARRHLQERLILIMSCAMMIAKSLHQGSQAPCDDF